MASDLDERKEPTNSSPKRVGQQMVRSRYPYLVKQRHCWFVRMVVPADVRDIIGQAIFKVPTGHTDEHQAATIAPILV